MPQVNSPPTLCVSLHDVAPSTWPACQVLLKMLDQLGPIPVTLLVVPDYHGRGSIESDRGFLHAIDRRLARGDEVVLHGYYHRDDQGCDGPRAWLSRRIYTAAEGEFAALAQNEARARLERGLALFARVGWPVSGFVAPAWLMGQGTRAALMDLPLAYTTTVRAIYQLPTWKETVAPSLVYSVRSAVRRVLSHGWNAALDWHLRQPQRACAGPWRYGIHPADARYADVVSAWQRYVVRALLQGCQPLTKQAWVQRGICVAPGPS